MLPGVAKRLLMNPVFHLSRIKVGYFPVSIKNHWNKIHHREQNVHRSFTRVIPLESTYLRTSLWFFFNNRRCSLARSFLPKLRYKPRTKGLNVFKIETNVSASNLDTSNLRCRFSKLKRRAWCTPVTHLSLAPCTEVHRGFRCWWSARAHPT